MFECRRRSTKEALFVVTFTIAEEGKDVVPDNVEEENSADVD